MSTSGFLAFLASHSLGAITAVVIAVVIAWIIAERI